MSAVRLQPSVLAPQRELLAHDVDLTQLDLTLRGSAGYSILEAITAGTVERTIDGASQVKLTVLDRDLKLLQSRYLGNGVDIRIDGLWFRLAAVSLQTARQLALTFEDREVALLRSYPKEPAPVSILRHFVPVSKMTRAEYARTLVREVKETAIRFWSPALGDTTAAGALDPIPSGVARSPGFSPGATITVKGRPATAEQKANLAAVIQAGIDTPGVGLMLQKLLIAAVMTVTQESDAINLVGGDRNSVGLFQQRATINGVRTDWPASRIPAVDAAAFYAKALEINKQEPTLPLGRLCSQVQRDYTVGTPREGADYQQWAEEATRTVEAYGVFGGTSTSAAGGGSPAGRDPFSFDPSALSGADSNKLGFYRGTIKTIAGRQKWVKEDNWDCLGRLAREVGWRRFCVSGTVYFASDADLIDRAGPVMTLTPDTDGLVDLGFDFDPRRKRLDKQAQVSVQCRIDRWQAPPGTVVELQAWGIADGKWLVASISRSLFGAAGQITLKKPQPVMPESQAPEFQNGTGSTSRVFVPGASGGATLGEQQLRNAIVAAAEKALANRADYRYAKVRPMPASLFGPYPETLDCSSFVTLCYKAGGAPDPNGNGYNGAGYTGTLVKNGVWTHTPQPADLVFYGSSRNVPDHVALFIGDGAIINHGSPGEPAKENVLDVPLPVIGYMTYLGGDTADPRRHEGA